MTYISDKLTSLIECVKIVEHPEKYPVTYINRTRENIWELKTTIENAFYEMYKLCEHCKHREGYECQKHGCAISRVKKVKCADWEER